MHELVLSPDEIEIECPEIHGLATPLKAYKLAWKLNQLPYFKARKTEDAQNYVNEGYHLMYEIDDLDHDALLLLVKNKGTNGFFYKKYKEFDFLLFSIAPHLQIVNRSLTKIKAMNDLSLFITLEPVQSPENMNFAQLL